MAKTKTSTSVPILIGYLRASDSKSLEQQADELVRVGVDRMAIFSDQDSSSGRRPGWQSLWKELGEGDKLVVPDLGCLGRDLVEIVMTADALKTRFVGLKVLQDGIDTSELFGGRLLDVFTKLADYERARADVHAVRSTATGPGKGSGVGRPPKLTQEMVDAALVRVQSGESAKRVAEDYNVHRNSLLRRMDDRRKELRLESKNAGL